MRVLLQDAQTGLYKDKGGAWVREAAQAADFGTIEAAGQSALACDRDSINVVLKYEEPDCQLALNPAYCVRRLPPNGPRLDTYAGSPPEPKLGPEAAARTGNSPLK